MIECCITDRRSLASWEEWERVVRGALEAGMWVQVREKQLTARELARWVEQAVAWRGSGPGKVLVNGRLDVAMACGADGVHWPSGWPELGRFRRLVTGDMLMGVSAHTMDDLRVAERERADYAMYSPIFQSPGKGLGAGIAELARVTGSVDVPVLALGGVTQGNAGACIAAGAVGVAGIRLYQDRFIRQVSS